jgi:adenosylcobinamide kinase/adenosylcobinamide-phosphate guanylyltransferase
MIALVLGGAESGKSEVAERLAASLPQPVTYVATWTPVDDADMQARVAAHRARRPATWTTVESGADLPAVLAATAGTVLVDTLGTWVAGAGGVGADGISFAAESGALCAALGWRVGDTVLVSDEVGLSVHPSTEAGRRFREALGRVNTAVAALADPVWLVVAGRVVNLPRADV